MSILGSVRNGRMVDRVGKLLQNALKQNNVTPIVLDPLEADPQELVKQPLHFIQNPDEIPSWMKATHETVKKGGWIFCSGSRI